ncbi:hypothetical protein, partial [Klebsiella pneumoniae]|uniref:hypothetical protein n=1 Tax=Klebsiella pneumoniae TaxID=573 RepID=UPI001C4E873F
VPCSSFSLCNFAVTRVIRTILWSSPPGASLHLVLIPNPFSIPAVVYYFTLLTKIDNQYGS